MAAGEPRKAGAVSRWQFLVFGSLLILLSTIGEEIGWRGLLVPELAKVTGLTRTALLSGAIWAARHVPMIVFADYNGGTPAWYSTTCFVVMVVGISFPLAWLRLRSGSVWAAALCPAFHRSVILRKIEAVTRGGLPGGGGVPFEAFGKAQDAAAPEEGPPWSASPSSRPTPTKRISSSPSRFRKRREPEG